MSDKKKLIKSVSLGSLCGVLGCVILMCIFAVIMLTSGLLGAELTDYIMVAVTALGALGGGFVAAGRRIRHRFDGNPCCRCNPRRNRGRDMRSQREKRFLE